MQKVHYLGIPLRCDWRIMDKSNLDMYLGLGGQVDKCIYAKAGGLGEDQQGLSEHIP